MRDQCIEEHPQSLSHVSSLIFFRPIEDNPFSRSVASSACHPCGRSDLS